MKTGERITDREQQKRIIVRLENAYMTQKRSSTYTALEEIVEFQWDSRQVKEFDAQWKAGWTVEMISSHFGRSVDDIEILAKDRIKKGVIEYRSEKEKKQLSNIQLFTSDSEEWGTPQAFYDKLHEEFSFALDPCATHENHKCPVYFTKEDNGLQQDWSKHKSVFVNPPYGRQLGKWVKKAYEESLKGATVVMLIPARVETSYWQKYIQDKATEIRFVNGRLKFEQEGATNSATFPSAVIIYTPKKFPRISWV